MNDIQTIIDDWLYDSKIVKYNPLRMQILESYIERNKQSYQVLYRGMYFHFDNYIRSVHDLKKKYHSPKEVPIINAPIGSIYSFDEVCSFTLDKGLAKLYSNNLYLKDADFQLLLEIKNLKGLLITDCLHYEGLTTDADIEILAKPSIFISDKEMLSDNSMYIRALEI